jgi:hypothetical protein
MLEVIRVDRRLGKVKHQPSRRRRAISLLVGIVGRLNAAVEGVDSAVEPVLLEDGNRGLVRRDGISGRLGERLRDVMRAETNGGRERRSLNGRVALLQSALEIVATETH